LFDKDDGLFSFSNFTSAIRVKNPTELDFRFLHKHLFWAYLSGVTEGMQSHSTGIRNLDANAYKAIQIAIPPLPEQHRIVAILDEAFEGMATAKANAEKNLQNARALFESHLQAVFTERGEGWIVPGKKLYELCELIVDCEHKTAPVQDEGYPSIRTTNIGKGKLILDGVNRVSQDTYDAWTRRAVPQSGDLIFAREAPAGNVAVIPNGLKVCLGQRTVLIRPKKAVFDPHFLAALLLAPQMQQRLVAQSKGATVKHINMKDIRALDVGSIPPTDVQQALAKRMSDVSSERERLESLYQQKLIALDELKKSLLHQAFSGQL
jgi:type I restriction enzyme S subunit